MNIYPDERLMRWVFRLDDKVVYEYDDIKTNSRNEITGYTENKFPDKLNGSTITNFDYRIGFQAKNPSEDFFISKVHDNVAFTTISNKSIIIPVINGKKIITTDIKSIKQYKGLLQLLDSVHSKQFINKYLLKVSIEVKECYITYTFGIEYPNIDNKKEYKYIFNVDIAPKEDCELGFEIRHNLPMVHQFVFSKSEVSLLPIAKHEKLVSLDLYKLLK